MRRLAVILLLATAALTATAAASGGGEHPKGRAHVGLRAQNDTRGAISARVPHGWHLIRRRLTDVLYPIPALAVASFPVRHIGTPCVCGEPSIRDFPRRGAFLFVWEYVQVPAAGLSKVPPRPPRFHISPQTVDGYECGSPNWNSAFRDAGRIFHVEVYLGAAAGARVRGRMAALLDSLKVFRRARQTARG